MRPAPYLIPTLTTARLRLRPFRLDDAERVFQLASSREVAATTLNLPHPYPGAGAAREWIAGHAGLANTGAAVICAVTRHGVDEVIGAIALHVNTDHQRAEMGYWIGLPFWGQGYGTEAAAAMRDWGFDDAGLHRIHAHAFMENRASTRIMEKIGMLPEGVLRGHIRKGDVPVDLAMYGMVAGDHRPQPATGPG